MEPPEVAEGGDGDSCRPMPRRKDEYVCLGLMSGTSLDGVDLCCVRFQLAALGDFEVLAAETRAYPEAWRTRLKDAFEAEGSESLEIQDLHLAYGEYLGGLVHSFLEDNRSNLPKDGVDLIASHGHTVHHRPDLGVTVQVGCGAAIQRVTGITTVSNFREQDVKLGGQGAPLVPIGDELLFDGHEVCLNLGGIANLSFRDDGGSRIAFDVVPVNLVLNHYAAKLGLPYDAAGASARTGTTCPSLLANLNGLDFYDQVGPKSLGYEFVVSTVLPLLGASKDLTVEDLLSTFTEHAACQISRTLKKTGKSKVLVTGG